MPNQQAPTGLLAEVKSIIEESARVKQRMAAELAPQIVALAERVIATYQKGGRVIAFGNGGSAADAIHLAAELVGRYDRERRPLPAFALTSDASTLTCISNDYGYEQIFARQLEAHAQPNDLIIGITTSGRSPNVLAALEVARQRGCPNVVLTGRDGGQAAQLAEQSIIIPSQSTARIQEGHALIIHIICELVDQWLLDHKD